MKTREQVDAFLAKHTEALKAALKDKEAHIITRLFDNRNQESHDVYYVAYDRDGQIPFTHQLFFEVKILVSGRPRNLMSFNLQTMTNLCGAMVLTNLCRYTYSDITNRSLADWLFNFVADFARECKYGSVICTNVVPRQEVTAETKLPRDIDAYRQGKFKAHALRHGYKVSNAFINPRTTSLINIFTLNL